MVAPEGVAVAPVLVMVAEPYPDLVERVRVPVVVDRLVVVAEMASQTEFLLVQRLVAVIAPAVVAVSPLLSPPRAGAVAAQRIAQVRLPVAGVPVVWFVCQRPVCPGAVAFQEVVAGVVAGP